MDLIKESIGISSIESSKPLSVPTEAHQRLEPCCSYNNQTKGFKSFYNSRDGSKADQKSRINFQTSSRKEYRQKYKISSKDSKYTESLTKIKTRDSQFFPLKLKEAESNCIEVKPEKNTKVSNRTDYEKKKAICNECKSNSSSEPQRHSETTVVEDFFQIDSKIENAKFHTRTLDPPPGFEKISPKNLTE